MTHILRYICVLISSSFLSSVALADDIFITADRANDVEKGKIIGKVAIFVHDGHIVQVGTLQRSSVTNAATTSCHYPACKTPETGNYVMRNERRY